VRGEVGRQKALWKRAEQPSAALASIERGALAVEPLEQRISVEADTTADLGHAGEFTAIDHAVHGLPGNSEKFGDFIHAHQVRELSCIAA
jgi:hypothetical protein